MKIYLLFDCIRAPYDIANILQVSLALPCVELHFSGNSIRHDIEKISGKVKSWSSKYKKGIISPNYTNFNFNICVRSEKRDIC